MTTVNEVPTLTLLPQYTNTEVIKPGGRKGKGGNPHHYLVDGVKHNRVTTILNDTIPKPGLVPWAKNVALDKFADSLTDWLNQGTIDVTDVPSLKEQARNRPDEIKDEAADWGTRAHETIQQYIEGLVTVGNILADLHPTIAAFDNFSDSIGVQWVATEMTVWDDKLLVAGTVDAIGWSPKGWILADWKTGKNFYPEMALQLSAYTAMFERITNAPVTEAYVVRFPREQPKRAQCEECAGAGDVWYARAPARQECPVCNGNGGIHLPSFEIRKVANLSRGWDRYQELVAQRQYTSDGVWDAHDAAVEARQPAGAE